MNFFERKFELSLLLPILYYNIKDMICGTTKIPFFIFASVNVNYFSHKYLKQSLYSMWCFTEKKVRLGKLT